MNNISSSRPSGASVLTDVVVKVFPTELDAELSAARHTDNRHSAAALLGVHGRAIVLEKLQPVNLSSKELFRALLSQKLMESVWNNESTQGCSWTSVVGYLAYVLRGAGLPQKFRTAVESTSSRLGTPDCRQVHGDFTRDNVLVDPQTGLFKLIDFSIRPEINYREADRAKFWFHAFTMEGEALWTPYDQERFFIACHFCRVWTRDASRRADLERQHADFLAHF